MRLLLSVAGILVPTLVALSLCVVMLCRWRQNKDPLPAPARNALNRTSTAFNRTFRRRADRQTSSVQYDSSTDGKPVNNELKSLVRSIQIVWNIGTDLDGYTFYSSFVVAYFLRYSNYCLASVSAAAYRPAKDRSTTISQKSPLGAISKKLTC